MCQWLGYKVPRELNLWIVWGLESYLTGLTYIIDRFTNYIVVIYIKCKKERRRIKLESILVICNIKISHTTDVALKLLNRKLSKGNEIKNDIKVKTKYW